MALIDKLNAIGDAIREKNGTTERIPLVDMPDAIKGISGESIVLNIAYGEAQPEDTSKLWIKANEPDNLLVCSDIKNEYSISSMNALSYVGQEAGCARVANKIYLFGGFSSDYSDAISVFDIATQTITVLSVKIPVPLAYMGCESVGKNIYLFGGYNSNGYQNTVYAFDTETETIADIATIPKTISNLTCVAVGKKIYTFGGQNTDSSYENAIYMLDTDEEQIYTLDTVLPFRKSNIGCCGVGEKIYLFGGGAGTADSNKIYEFDVVKENIQSIEADLPTIHFGIRCARMGSDIYLFGGWAKSGITDSIYVFNTKTKKFTQPEINLPEKLWRFGCAESGNKVYIFGGSGENDSIYCFTATHSLLKGNMELEIGLLTNKFNLINSDIMQAEIGVENVFLGNANDKAELCEAYLHNGSEWVLI